MAKSFKLALDFCLPSQSLKEYLIEKKSCSYHYDNVFSKESLKSALTIPVGDLKEEYKLTRTTDTSFSLCLSLDRPDIHWVNIKAKNFNFYKSLLKCGYQTLVKL